MRHRNSETLASIGCVDIEGFTKSSCTSFSAKYCTFFGEKNGHEKPVHQVLGWYLSTYWEGGLVRRCPHQQMWNSNSRNSVHEGEKHWVRVLCFEKSASGGFVLRAICTDLAVRGREAHIERTSNAEIAILLREVVSEVRRDLSCKSK